MIDTKKAIKRKIFLKRQVIEVTQAEITDLKFRLSLFSLKDDLEKRIDDREDFLLSQKIDCLNFLLEN